jgi:hypothetical protein
VHFALLSDRDQEASGVREPIESAKLQSRHWIVRDSSGAVTDRIDGDGVLGEFPVLRAGEAPVFVPGTSLLVVASKSISSRRSHSVTCTGLTAVLWCVHAGAEGYRYTSCMMHSEPHASMVSPISHRTVLYLLHSTLSTTQHSIYYTALYLLHSTLSTTQ